MKALGGNVEYSQIFDDLCANHGGKLKAEPFTSGLI